MSKTWIKPACAAPSGDRYCDSTSLLADERGEKNIQHPLIFLLPAIPPASSGWCLNPMSFLPAAVWGAFNHAHREPSFEFGYFSVSSSPTRLLFNPTTTPLTIATSP